MLYGSNFNLSYSFLDPDMYIKPSADYNYQEHHYKIFQGMIKLCSFPPVLLLPLCLLYKCSHNSDVEIKRTSCLWTNVSIWRSESKPGMRVNVDLTDNF